MKKYIGILKYRKTLICLCMLIFVILLFPTMHYTYGITADKNNLRLEVGINDKYKSIKIAKVDAMIGKQGIIANSLMTQQANYDNNKFPYKKLLEEIVKDNRRIDKSSNFIKQIVDDNNRLDYYDLYIKLAKQEGYVVTSYSDYLKNYLNTNQKVLILRHDIDVKSDATKDMFEIEKRNNVKATYYFRWVTFDKDLIKEISDAGFEVGLHYETIATYCIEHKTRVIKHEDIVKCREILKEEIKEFKEKSGVNIETVSSHGNPINKEIGIPNNVLFIGENYKDYGIIGETYDKYIVKYKIKSYICDGEISKNYGYSYSTNPIDSILKSDRVIEFLSHPNHWYYSLNSRVKMYIEIEDKHLLL